MRAALHEHDASSTDDSTDNSTGGSTADSTGGSTADSTGGSTDGSGTGGPTRPQPAVVPLVENRLLTGEGGTKEVRRFTFDLSDTELTYAAGDALTVTPRNREDLVEEWLTATGLDAEDEVTVDDDTLTFADALRDRRDITAVTRDLVTFVAERCGDDGLRGLLERERKADLAEWSWGRQAVDLLHEYDVGDAGAQEWIDVLGALRARQYSISSSPTARPDRVSLTVSVVRYDGPTGSRRSGVCSGFLADAEDGAHAQVRVQPAPHFGLPDDPSTPMIMIGPGTGIAPFVGFLEERRARGDERPNWLFFGEQHEETDFYYREELTTMREDGLLDRLDLAFSRDQEDKVYVQHRLAENGEELWRWIDAEKARVYVCGDALRMAKDVDAALRALVAEHGVLSADDAAAYVKAMGKEKRYVRDVY